ncbi:MAG: hypothetical protein NTZ78_06720 [Candidatus Aureabacteria bacterium]|nr:hypothetical protein [Candidatus Auribacterota bacterium]
MKNCALSILAVFALFLATASQAEAGQAFFYINGICTPQSQVDDNMGNRLKVGDLIQVIYSNGEIDPPDPKNPNYIGGDDRLLGKWAVGNDEAQWGNIGAGEITISVSGDAKAEVYLRVWDADTISGAHYYGDTATYAMSPEMSVPPDYCIPSFSTNKPKPTIKPTPTPTIAPTSTPSGTPTLPPAPMNTPTRTPAPADTPSDRPIPATDRQ